MSDTRYMAKTTKTLAQVLKSGGSVEYNYSEQAGFLVTVTYGEISLSGTDPTSMCRALQNAQTGLDNHLR